jgi:hypothetical protein
MFHLGIVNLIIAEREREIESNIRRQRWLRPEDAAIDPVVPVRRSEHSRSMAIRVRPTGG